MLKNMKNTIAVIENNIEFCHSILSTVPSSVKKNLVIPISIFMSIIDISSDVTLLLKEQRRVSATIILRSLTEMLFDLFLLEKDIGYVNSLLLRYAKDQKELFEGCLDPNSLKYVKNKEERDKIQCHLKTLKNGPIENSNNNYEILGPGQKFSILKENQFYKSVYLKLCQEVHCNLSAIEKRHFKEGKNGKLKLIYANDHSEEEYPISEPLILTIIYSAITFNSIIGLGMESTINKMIEQSNTLLSNEKLEYLT